MRDGGEGKERGAERGWVNKGGMHIHGCKNGVPSLSFFCVPLVCQGTQATFSYCVGGSELERRRERGHQTPQLSAWRAC